MQLLRAFSSSSSYVVILNHQMYDLLPYRRDPKAGSMKYAFGLYCIGLPALGAACAADSSEYRLALDANDYANYQIVEASDDARRRQERSSGHFEEDVLVGDFNFDGREDFAAILSRSATQAEIDRTYFPPDQEHLERRTFMAIVCNGLDETSSADRYRCMPLSESVVGGFGGELTILDPSEWGGDLSMLNEAAGNAQCPLVMPSFSNRLLLALGEPVGRCTTYYYPDPKGTYGQCIYCAD